MERHSGHCRAVAVVPQNPKAERHLRLEWIDQMQCVSPVPQNPKAERHLRLAIPSSERMDIDLVPQNPKAERHLRPRRAISHCRGRRKRSPEPKSRKAFETLLGL